MAVDMFLEIDGISGESVDSVHRGTIQIEDVKYALKVPTAAGGGGTTTGRRQWTNVTVIKRVDVASPMLIKAACQNERIREAKIFVRKAGVDPRDYYTITMQEARISQVELLGPGVPEGASPNTLRGSDPDLRERIDINFARITFDYSVQSSDGTLGGSTSFTDEFRNATA